jgi:hypothetical protein
VRQGFDVDANWLEINSLQSNVVVPATRSFSFDPIQRIATWQFERALSAGRYMIRFGSPADLADPTSENVSEFPLHFSPGDLDYDLDVDADDITALQTAARLGVTDVAFDLNSDGEVTQGDVAMLVREILGTEFGDANLDGFVDARDAETWKTHVFSADSSWSSGDFDGDGLTDVRDFNVWLAHRSTQVVSALMAVGDINADSRIDREDVEAIKSLRDQGGYALRADLDRDALITADDLNLLVHDILQAQPGDANLDGVVDTIDFQIVVQGHSTDLADWLNGDFDRDGRVTMADFDAWSTHRFEVSAEHGVAVRPVRSIPRSPASERIAVPGTPTNDPLIGAALEVERSQVAKSQGVDPQVSESVFAEATGQQTPNRPIWSGAKRQVVESLVASTRGIRDVADSDDDALLLSGSDAFFAILDRKSDGSAQ